MTTTAPGQGPVTRGGAWPSSSRVDGGNPGPLRSEPRRGGILTTEPGGAVPSELLTHACRCRSLTNGATTRQPPPPREGLCSIPSIWSSPTARCPGRSACSLPPLIMPSLCARGAWQSLREVDRMPHPTIPETCPPGEDLRSFSSITRSGISVCPTVSILIVCEG